MQQKKIKRKVTFDFFWLTFDFSDLRLIFGTCVWFLIFEQQGPAPVGPEFATNGEHTATNPFALYGERTQLLIVSQCNSLSRGGGGCGFIVNDTCSFILLFLQAVEIFPSYTIIQRITCRLVWMWSTIKWYVSLSMNFLVLLIFRKW